MAERKGLNLLDDIEDLRTQSPFVPFVIVIASGDRYRIEAPENLVKMRSEFFYAFPGSDRFVLIRMNQIAAVERGETKRSRTRKAS